ncbi:MAG: hypothetical protein EA426_17740 [Spirochaetaceae bacterium]|nr:MAG: hypothetical protein EA426_17740 [Spirochaetaceae bacterium]
MIPRPARVRNSGIAVDAMLVYISCMVRRLEKRGLWGTAIVAIMLGAVAGGEVHGMEQRLRDEFLAWEAPVFGPAAHARRTHTELTRAVAATDGDTSDIGLARQANLLMLRSFIEIYRLDLRDDARETLAEARIHAERLVDRSPSAFAYRTLADISAQQMLLASTLQIISLAPRVEQLAKKALEYDKHDAGAINLIAFGRLNAPRLFGGNPEEAQTLFLRALESPEIMPSQRFAAYIGLAETLEKLRRREEAAVYRERARELFPDHWDL